MLDRESFSISKLILEEKHFFLKDNKYTWDLRAIWRQR